MQNHLWHHDTSSPLQVRNPIQMILASSQLRYKNIQVCLVNIDLQVALFCSKTVP